METGSKVRVGVVGAGKMGEYHLQKYLALNEASVVGFYDTNLDRAREVQSKYGVTAFETLAELLFEVDAISIASPTDTHGPVGRAALDAGAHILVEKPIAASVEEAEAMDLLAREKGLVLQVGMVERFRLVALSGGLPLMPALFIETHRLSPQVGRERTLDVISDLMIHDLDLALSLVDEDPHFVSAIGMKVVTSEFDIANVRLEFPSGTIINLNVSRVSAEPLRKLRLFSKSAYASFDFRDNKATVYQRNGSSEVQKDFRQAPGYDPLLEQNRDFLRCVRTGESPLVRGSDGIRALRFAKIVLQKMEARERASVLPQKEPPPEARE